MTLAEEGGGREEQLDESIVGIHQINIGGITGSWGALVVGEKGGVTLLSSANPSGRSLFRYPQKIEFSSLAPDGIALAVAFGATVDILNPVTGVRLERFDRLRSRVTALDWAPGSGALLIGAADGKVYRWRFDHEVTDLPPTEWSRRFERYIGHSTTVGAVRYHPLGRLFFSGDWDGSLSAWRDYEADGEKERFERDPLGGEFHTRKTERVTVRRPGGGDGVEALDIDREGKRLAIGRQDGSFDLWSVRGLKHLTTQTVGRGAINDLRLGVDGGTIAMVSRDGRARVFQLREVPTGIVVESLQEVEVHGGVRVALISNGTLLVGTKRGKVEVVSF